MPELQVYSREGCHLCEDMLDALQQFKNELAYTIKVYDIDDDPVLLERFNVLVPVVFLRNHEIMRYQFELATLKEALVDRHFLEV